MRHVRRTRSVPDRPQSRPVDACLARHTAGARCVRRNPEGSLVQPELVWYLLVHADRNVELLIVLAPVLVLQIDVVPGRAALGRAAVGAGRRPPRRLEAAALKRNDGHHAGVVRGLRTSETLDMHHVAVALLPLALVELHRKVGLGVLGVRDVRPVVG
eukprot:2156832-Prymnesium_polylepis.1